MEDKKRFLLTYVYFMSFIPKFDFCWYETEEEMLDDIKNLKEEYKGRKFEVYDAIEIQGNMRNVDY